MNARSRDDAATSMRGRIERELPGVAIEMGEEGDGKWIRLPPSPHADYRWSFWFYPSGDRHIYANLVSSQDKSASMECVLWYHPFELDGFKQSVAHLADAFEKEVQLLLDSATRITQKRGPLNWTITLEREAKPGRWQLVYTFFALRAGWETPHGNQESKTYFAPASK